ncbi:hypothetical protein ACS0TY_020034 [Phlomoides rotata]
MSVIHCLFHLGSAGAFAVFEGGTAILDGGAAVLALVAEADRGGRHLEGHCWRSTRAVTRTLRWWRKHLVAAKNRRGVDGKLAIFDGGAVIFEGGAVVPVLVELAARIRKVTVRNPEDHAKLDSEGNYRVTFLIVEACLLASSVRNTYHTKCTTQFFNQPPSCKTVRNGVFVVGAAFILFTGIISEFYYTRYFKARGCFKSYKGEDWVGMASYK